LANRLELYCLLKTVAEHDNGGSVDT